MRDLGSPGLDLASNLRGHDAVIVVDTVLAKGPPGSLHVLGREHLETTPAAAGRMTQHEADLVGALALADLAGDAPRVLMLIGVVPLDLGRGPGLSPVVAAACNPAVDLVLHELAGFGHGVVPYERRRPATAWWSDEE